VDERRELGAHVLRIEDGRDHLRHLRGRHRADADGLGEAGALPDLHHARQGVQPSELVAAVRREHHHAAAHESPRDVVEQVTRRAVRPVDVVDDDEQAALAGPLLQQGDDRLEHAQLGLLGVGGRGRLGAVAQLRKELREHGGRRSEVAPQLSEVVLPELVPDRLDEGQVRQ